MNNQYVEVDWGEIVGFLLDWGVFLLGALLMFSKTSELMAAFAPQKIMGYEGVGAIYGVLCALLVEGVLVLMKIQLGNSANPIAWLWNILLMASTYLISLFAQGIDSIVVRDTLASQPLEIQLIVTWVVPAIPAIVFGLFLVRRVVETIPPSFLKKKKKSEDGDKPRRVDINPTKGEKSP